MANDIQEDLYPRHLRLGLIEARSRIRSRRGFASHIRGIYASASLKHPPRVCRVDLRHHIRGIYASASLKLLPFSAAALTLIPQYPRHLRLGLIEARASRGVQPREMIHIRGIYASASLKRPRNESMGRYLS